MKTTSEKLDNIIRSKSEVNEIVNGKSYTGSFPWMVFTFLRKVKFCNWDEFASMSTDPSIKVTFSRRERSVKFKLM